MARKKIASGVLIDTSALLALANPCDQYHTRAVAIAKRLVESGSRLIGTVLILAEFQAHFLYLMGPARARAIVTDLMNDPLYEWRDVSAELVSAAVSAWLERFRDQRFSLADAVSFEVMSRDSLEQAFAFDQHYRTVGFEVLA
jgi:hypothetical protein